MKTKLIGPLVLVFALSAVVAWTVRAQKPSATPSTAVVSTRTQWEYKIVSESEKVALNDLGAQGWELVAVTNGGAEEVYYFKRAK